MKFISSFDDLTDHIVETSTIHSIGICCYLLYVDGCREPLLKE